MLDKGIVLLIWLLKIYDNENNSARFHVIALKNSQYGTYPLGILRSAFGPLVGTLFLGAPSPSFFVGDGLWGVVFFDMCRCLKEPFLSGLR